MLRLIALFLIVALAGCAGSPTHISLLEGQGGVRFDIADDPSYDRKVVVRNTLDIGWDGDRKEDRLKAVEGLRGEACPDPRVIEEIPIDTGKYFDGRTSRTWVIKVKCNRASEGGASQIDPGKRVRRGQKARRTFMATTPCPYTIEQGCIVDHIVPLKRGGADDPGNMQWQTRDAAKAKDRWE